MNRFLQLKKSNCKNCYKCIRSCPVKSIKFADGQANIIADDCILCGNCFVNCPQDAKQVRLDTPHVKELIASGRPVIASVALLSLRNFRERFCRHAYCASFSGLPLMPRKPQLALLWSNRSTNE